MSGRKCEYGIRKSERGNAYSQCCKDDVRTTGRGDDMATALAAGRSSLLDALRRRRSNG